ncbi:MAG: tetratricopeptide repeat protein [Planctomycetota bacterium]
MTSFRIVLLALTGVLVCACSNQRALHMVEDSGERAMRRGDYRLAESEYREIVDRRPGRWDARIELGRALLELDQPAEAREELEVAYTINPNDAELLELLAEAMLGSGDVDAMARELRHRAVESNTVPDWLRLGIFLQRAGDLDGAEQALLTAAQLDRGRRVQPQTSLAALYRAAGDDAKALLRLRMALYINPDDARVQELIRSYGEVPGPTYAVEPTEARADVER